MRVASTGLIQANWAASMTGVRPSRSSTGLGALSEIARLFMARWPPAWLLPDVC